RSSRSSRSGRQPARAAWCRGCASRCPRWSSRRVPLEVPQPAPAVGEAVQAAVDAAGDGLEVVEVGERVQALGHPVRASDGHGDGRLGGLVRVVYEAVVTENALAELGVVRLAGELDVAAAAVAPAVSRLVIPEPA